MYPINGPEVILPFAQDKFDANDTNGLEYQEILETINSESCRLA